MRLDFWPTGAAAPARTVFAWLPRAALLALLLSTAAHAQQTPAAQAPLISANLDSVRFDEFVRRVEAQTPHRFYFEAEAVDSLRISLHVQQQPLAQVLERALQPSGLKFAIDAHRRIYITRGAAVLTDLPEHYQLPSADSPVAGLAPDDAALLSSTAAARRRRAAAEQKLVEVGTGQPDKSRPTLAGYIRDLKTGEGVAGATVFIESPPTGASTDQFGFYSLTLPAGRHEVRVRGIGLKSTRRQVLLRADGKLDIDVEEDITPLKEVVIEGNKDANVARVQMGVEKLDIKTIRQVPTAFGETDILRVVMTLPGVKSVGEGSTGMNVRGGATDQNLILLNDATIFNPSHLFGFFSAFNPDMLRSVELHKSVVPARHGGRLSSVLDIATRDGNKKEFGGAGGIGLLSSRLTLEGPLAKDRSAFLVGGRTSYSDWLLQKLPNRSLRESAASFYDLNAHLTHELNERNTFYATGYLSRDKFKLASDTLYAYRNLAGSLKWKHVFNNQLYGVVTATHSGYEYDIASEKNPVNASELSYGIKQTGLRADVNYFQSNRHTLDFGASTLLYNVQPGQIKPRGAESLIGRDVLARERAVESAVYAASLLDLTPRLAISLGLRYSLFNALGPRQVYEYLPGVSRSTSTIADTLDYRGGQVLATHHGPEYRVSAKYALTDNSSVKLGFGRMRQYLHMLSNTASMSPTDIWKLSDNNIRPQVGDQVSLGYYRNFKRNTIETSVEAYYKRTKDFVDYKSGASLILNHTIETDVVNARGEAYGVEVLVKKLTGKLNGWVSYTYSRSLVQLNPPVVADRINGGRWYPSNFDKPHDFTLIGNYRFNRRFSASLNFNYSTGRPITLPLAKYYVGNSMRVYYSERNAYRVPDYYRADFALNIEGNHKVKKLAHSSWTVSVYNLTGRKNPYSIYFRAENGRINGYQLSIFGQPIPTVTYNFKF
ncbi:carboxypeptidase-like regulatory domain-containing protein [Hymenobacter sp. B81]|uniref:TonB-dependent receptor n=1 Tax=Hymenobacter sp. B81 TaxID=3344878 RepID=UPI0037DD73E6